jgi:hypothetical protein
VQTENDLHQFCTNTLIASHEVLAQQFTRLTKYLTAFQRASLGSDSRVLEAPALDIPQPHYRTQIPLSPSPRKTKQRIHVNERDHSANITPLSTKHISFHIEEEQEDKGKTKMPDEGAPRVLLLDEEAETPSCNILEIEVLKGKDNNNNNSSNNNNNNNNNSNNNNNKSENNNDAPETNQNRAQLPIEDFNETSTHQLKQTPQSVVPLALMEELHFLGDQVVPRLTSGPPLLIFELRFFVCGTDSLEYSCYVVSPFCSTSLPTHMTGFWSTGRLHFSMTFL